MSTKENLGTILAEIAEAISGEELVQDGKNDLTESLEVIRDAFVEGTIGGAPDDVDSNESKTLYVFNPSGTGMIGTYDYMGLLKYIYAYNEHKGIGGYLPEGMINTVIMDGVCDAILNKNQKAYAICGLNGSTVDYPQIYLFNNGGQYKDVVLKPIEVKFSATADTLSLNFLAKDYSTTLNKLPISKPLNDLDSPWKLGDYALDF